MAVYELLGDGNEPRTIENHPGVAEELLDVEENCFQCSKCKLKAGQTFS